MKTNNTQKIKSKSKNIYGLCTTFSHAPRLHLCKLTVIFGNIPFLERQIFLFYFFIFSATLVNANHTLCVRYQYLYIPNFECSVQLYRFSFHNDCRRTFMNHIPYF